jgi:hypothetical protein
MEDFVVKDSGNRTEYQSGMVRDLNDDKEKFDLLFPEGVPYEEQMITRFAVHLTKGAKKYNDRNWEKANGENELRDFKRSAWRHFIKWFLGMRDEDHAAGVFFNITAYETTKFKIDNTVQPF